MAELPSPEAFRALEATVRDVQRQMAELQRVWAVGDADRQISVADFARSINRAPSTVLGWWRNDHDRAKWHLLEVIQRDVAGRLYTTPRLVEKWRYATLARLVPPRLTESQGRAGHPAPRTREQSGLPSRPGARGTSPK